MKHVLITGMSGAGKSSLLHELAAHGYRTVDTGYGDYFQTVDGKSQRPAGSERHAGSQAQSVRPTG